MFKFHPFTGIQSLNEIPQHNPLRWTILYKRDYGSFDTQSIEIKCRDFFNDLVAAKQAQHYFSIYGFKNENVEWNKEGLYFKLSYLYDAAKVCQKIETSLNPKIEEQLGKEAVLKPIIIDTKSILLLIPNEFWESTYRISALTMLIRAINYAFESSSWDDLFKDTAALMSMEHSWMLDNKKHIHKHGFLLPKGTENMWFFYGKECNSTLEKDYWKSSSVHNCGVSNWLYCHSRGI
jgi:hypothetical protein